MLAQRGRGRRGLLVQIFMARAYCMSYRCIPESLGAWSSVVQNPIYQTSFLRRTHTIRMWYTSSAHLVIHPSPQARMSFDSRNITGASLSLPQALAWSNLGNGFGFVSGPFSWLCMAALLSGFVLAHSQHQTSFKELHDKAGNSIPDGPKPLPILGKSSFMSV